MSAGVAFDDLLDGHLAQQAAVVGRAGAAWSVATGTAATYGFFFDTRPHPAFGTMAVAATGIAMPQAAPAARPLGALHFDTPLFSPGPRATGAPGFDTCRPVAARRRGPWSDRQRAALEQLVALGARVNERSAPDELRSAFRALARRYHPDRHTCATASERAHLASQFARVCDAYRLLTARSH
jgi:hypothetical protein